jgi:hypothetical protein
MSIGITCFHAQVKIESMVENLKQIQLSSQQQQSTTPSTPTIEMSSSQAPGASLTRHP